MNSDLHFDGRKVRKEVQRDLRKKITVKLHNVLSERTCLLRKALVEMTSLLSEMTGS